MKDTHDSIEMLARQVTGETVVADSPEAGTAIAPIKGSKLDPFSPRFDAFQWMKSFVHLFESDPETGPTRSAGVAFRNLSVFGDATDTEFQKTTGNIFLAMASSLVGLVSNSGTKRRQILREFEGIVDPGEMLLVLGPPGSGCSTFLRTISGRAEGLTLSQESHINFRGLTPKQMQSWFRSDLLYNAETDVHLPALTVGNTLEFASLARVPSKIPGGFTKTEFALAYRDAIMATFGITHTVDTKVGDDFIRGVSGGERKRVSIAEAALTGAKLQCWDNSTRGLDSGNAISFCNTLRVQADMMNVAALVAIYQAPQSAYEIYFGRTEDAKKYFEDLGFHCPERQTTADFLTSMTAPHERRLKPGFESAAPYTPEEFAARWKASAECAALNGELDRYDDEHPSEVRLDEFSQSRRAELKTSQRLKSPFTLSYREQVQLCLWRGWKRLLADPVFTIAQLVFNIAMGLILGSGFYDLPFNTDSFYHRGAVVFFGLLFNAFASELEVLTLYHQRPVVEKHHQYAFYHQSAEAISSYLMELPYKITNAITFNTLVYFLANLRREPGHYFFYILTNFLLTLSMSGLYRTIASVARTSHQALVPVALITIGVMIYTGFTIPADYLPGWSRWMGYIDPIGYAFEALLANEFHGRQFPCATLIPSGGDYDKLPASDRVCAVVGAVDGQSTVSGDRYIELSYDFHYSHKWRNIGILCGFASLFYCTYIIAAEYARPPKGKGEILVFRRSKMPSHLKSARKDIENQASEWPVVEKVSAIARSKEDDDVQLSPRMLQKPIFHWEDLCFDLTVNGKDRRILNHVDGWVQPGTITALMGASGAGKTTLLDALATRLNIGVLSGDTMVNGKPTDASFSHQVGYAQQQDLHLNTSTVREALEFSALLRQSAEIPRAEKLAYVDEVIGLLEMETFADAIIGAPGEGLNVEQRKRLTIGVELAARPQLLVFLDEPTSGLDSQTSWSVCDLIQKLARSGQAILCTIHQPSAMLFSRFDRLLLLQPGGKTVYFGDIGNESRKVIEYFEKHGAPRCPSTENPAEWILDVTLPSADGPDWSETWRSSGEYAAVKLELTRLRGLGSSNATEVGGFQSQHHEFVCPFWTQLWEVFFRTAKHFWRSPTYLWSKLSVTILFALFLGFSFTDSDLSLQGMKNQLYAFFMGFLILQPYNKQLMPFFTPQRSLYEAREGPSKIYHWVVFILSQVMVEFIWNTLGAVLFFFCWYYPVGFPSSTSDDASIRGFTTFLFIWQLLLWISTLSQAVIAPLVSAELAAVPATFIGILSMAFCGVGIMREQLPAIWADFVYYVSPMTYLASGVLSTVLHDANVTCSASEIVGIPAQAGMLCEQFLGPFIEGAGGVLVDTGSSDVCGWCAMTTSDDYLETFNIYYSQRWRNFGLLWAYIVFNVFLTLGFYYWARVPKKQSPKQK
ncbi:hypothetical protein G7Z17_g3859 [Cylindrodendrum hubeiense]|uniref:ABC transporter domain-containing protein n=1 Tax=Cylindrodendrum hubeiense TaxID=595255 RepID=A0A9P5HDW4_9HYPO|nr:hypothetical protein G7Z17_g3859 [Cylindrodendrum hubeiense]